MVIIVFTLIWGIALFIFLFYSLISLLFRVISYPRDFYHFAGNQQPAKIDRDLQYYVIVPCFNEAAVIQRTIKCLLGFKQFKIVVVVTIQLVRLSRLLTHGSIFCVGILLMPIQVRATY